MQRGTVASDQVARDGVDADDVLEAEVQHLQSEARRIAEGGWRRALIGFAVGAAAGFGVALITPRDRDDADRRS